jgi:hypothetical protein
MLALDVEVPAAVVGEHQVQKIDVELLSKAPVLQAFADAAGLLAVLQEVLKEVVQEELVVVVLDAVVVVQALARELTGPKM